MEKSKFVVCGRGCGSGGVGAWVARSAGVWAWVGGVVCGCVGSSVCGCVGMDVGAGVLVLVFFFFLKKECFLSFLFKSSKKCKKYGSQTSSGAQFLDFFAKKRKNS